MDLAVVADAFVVTVVGGLGSIPGAFLAALIIGLTKAICIGLATSSSAGSPSRFRELTLVAEFVVMAVVLAVKPHGLLGTPPPVLATTALPEQRELRPRPRRPRGRGSRSPCSVRWRCCRSARTTTCSCWPPTC